MKPAPSSASEAMNDGNRASHPHKAGTTDQPKQAALAGCRGAISAMPQWIAPTKVRITAP